MMAAELVGICISEKKGTAKHEVPEGTLREDWGLENDAHAGHWHRQVSLLASEEIEEFQRENGPVEPGAFGENLVTKGIDLRSLPVGTQLCVGNTVLEITQIGKTCHSGCEIYKRTGKCIMAGSGVFAVVKHGGTVHPGDEVKEKSPF